MQKSSSSQTFLMSQEEAGRGIQAGDLSEPQAMTWRGARLYHNDLARERDSSAYPRTPRPR